jgi:hypothetical protein
MHQLPLDLGRETHWTGMKELSGVTRRFVPLCKEKTLQINGQKDHSIDSAHSTNAHRSF